MIGAGNGWVGNLNLAYKLFADTQVAFTASHATTPTITGQLQLVESLGSSLNYTINHSSSLSLNAQYSRTKSAQNGTTSAAESEFFHSVSRLFVQVDTRMANKTQLHISPED